MEKIFFTSRFKIIFSCSVMFLMVSCDSKRTLREEIKSNLCKHEYYGMWAETIWTYQFHKDGTFTFLCDGHYDVNHKEMGIYTVLDSFILLVPHTDWDVYWGALKTKLKYIDENCIRDYNGYYYTSNFDSINYYNGLKYDFEEFTISVLNGLEEVIEEKARFPEKDAWPVPNPRFYYDGITVVNNVELHAFSLINYDDSPHRNNLISLFIKKTPFEVYQYNSAGNKLTLIYEK